MLTAEAAGTSRRAPGGGNKSNKTTTGVSHGAAESPKVTKSKAASTQAPPGTENLVPDSPRISHTEQPVRRSYCRAIAFVVIRPC